MACGREVLFVLPERVTGSAFTSIALITHDDVLGHSKRAPENGFGFALLARSAVRVFGASRGWQPAALKHGEVFTGSGTAGNGTDALLSPTTGETQRALPAVRVLSLPPVDCPSGAIAETIADSRIRVSVAGILAPFDRRSGKVSIAVHTLEGGRTVHDVNNLQMVVAVILACPH